MRTLSELDGTRWSGIAELWVDPLGNEVQTSDCTLSVDGDTVQYIWTHDGAAQSGRIAVREDGVEFRDTWHQPESMLCRAIPDSGALFQVAGSYGPDDDWGWRIALCLRAPTGELVLQMTNIAPWGEEARAVRMACARQP